MRERLLEAMAQLEPEQADILLLWVGSYLDIFAQGVSDLILDPYPSLAEILARFEDAISRTTVGGCSQSVKSMLTPQG